MPTRSDAAIRAVLDDLEAAGREPGGSVCVVRAGGEVVVHHVGTTDGSMPWGADTLVMTCSVAKPFAALAVLHVVAEGGIGLDTRVADLWPVYASHGSGRRTHPLTPTSRRVGATSRLDDPRVRDPAPTRQVGVGRPVSLRRLDGWVVLGDHDRGERVRRAIVT